MKETDILRLEIIAVDFDGCVCRAAYPDIGIARMDVIDGLLKRQANGAKLILWSCREGKLLDEAVAWCARRGLKFDAVNDNLPETIAFYGNNCRKIYATEYWDDKNVLVTSNSPRWLY